MVRRERRGCPQPVHADRRSGPDWREAAAYAPLIGADRSLFAWEWLRRDPLYRAAAVPALAATSPGALLAGRFGLVAFESPNLGVPEARPLWRIDAYPQVLIVEPCGGGAGVDRFDLEPLQALAKIRVGRDAEHLLLSDGLRTVRLDGELGSFTGGPVVLRYTFEGVASAAPPLLTLRRFLALCSTGRFARALHRPEPRARRWILMLRAFDALAAGAGQREIAQMLLSGSVGQPRWRSRESSVRSQVQRLVRGAREMAGGYRRLLAPRLDRS
jgi:hypothetical protein